MVRFRHLRRLAFGLLLVLGTNSAAFAHAFLDHADPAVGSTVTAPPKEIRLWFTEKLEPAFSTLHVADGAGKTVDSGDGAVDSSDSMQLRVSLPALPPGTYRVIWRVLSVDSHTTEGDFTFEVKAGEVRSGP